MRSPRASISARSSSMESSCTCPPGPKVQVSRSSRRWESSSGSLAGTTHAAPGRRSRISSALAAATRSTVPSSSRCTGPTFTITPTSGAAIAASSAICPSPSHCHLEHERLGAPARLEHGQRQPDLGVEVLAARVRARAGGEQRGEDVLRRGLAGGAGDAGHADAELVPPRVGEPPERRQRVVGDDGRRGGARGLAGGLPRGRHGRRTVLRPHEHAPRPGLERLRGERAAVRARAAQPHEQVARLERARVDHGALGAGALGIARGELGAGSLGDPPGGQVDHARTPPRARSASRATVTSSNGSLRPPSNS